MKIPFSIYKSPNLTLRVITLLLSVNLFSCNNNELNEIFSKDGFTGETRELDLPVLSENKINEDFIISESYVKNGILSFENTNYEEAIDNFIKALSINKNIVAYMYLVTFPKDMTGLIIDKLQEQKIHSPNEERWPYYIGKVFFHNGMYEEAADSFEQAFVLSNDEIYLRMKEDSLALISINSFNTEE